MNVQQLESAEEMWWLWAALAATHAATDSAAAGLDAPQSVLHFDTPDGSWVRMQRFRDGRAVLWGRDVDAEDDALTHGYDLLEDTPVWAASEVLSRSVHLDGVGFLAWFEAGEWHTGVPGLDDGSELLLEPLSDIGAVAREIRLRNSHALIDILPRVTADARVGALTHETFAAMLRERGRTATGHELLRAAREAADPRTHGPAHEHLRVAVHEQMRDAAELERSEPARPPMLVQWSRVVGVEPGFAHSVLYEHGRLIGAPDNLALPEQFKLTLTNALAQVHAEDADEESGGWLFARLAFDEGRRLTFERAYDSWPEWYPCTTPEQGPSLEGLAWEMAQRSPQWRPAWSALLPTDL